MDTFQQGDMVVLKSGSMKMLVEAVDGETVSLIWAHEGQIGRDTAPASVLKKWEERGDSRGPRRDDDRGPRGGGGRPHGGDREGGGKPYRGRDDRDDKPRGKPGWDGKPREKKYFRKDD